MQFFEFSLHEDFRLTFATSDTTDETTDNILCLAAWHPQISQSDFVTLPPYCITYIITLVP